MHQLPGQVLDSLSRLMKCDDAKGAEVYAMLIGCRELDKLEATNAMVQGDSFPTIQWGQARPRTRRVEISGLRGGDSPNQISAHLQCSFYHILQEANDKADHLARERVYL